MKTHYRRPLLAIIFVLNAHLLFAQEVIRQESCDIRPYQEQIDSVKSLFTSNGYILLREASMTMESEYEMPVIVPLTQGSWYQFVFIGDLSSKLYEVRMYDYNEKQVVYKKHYGDGMESNIISYSYIPQFTEYHIIKPVQVNKKKKKGICGYIMMFKKVK